MQANPLTRSHAHHFCIHFHYAGMPRTFLEWSAGSPFLLQLQLHLYPDLQEPLVN